MSSGISCGCGRVVGWRISSQSGSPSSSSGGMGSSTETTIPDFSLSFFPAPFSPMRTRPCAIHFCAWLRLMPGRLSCRNLSIRCPSCSEPTGRVMLLLMALDLLADLKAAVFLALDEDKVDQEQRHSDSHTDIRHVKDREVDQAEIEQVDHIAALPE